MLKPTDFSELEMMYLKIAQRQFFRRAEAQYFRYRNGLLDEAAWHTVRHRVWLNLQSPVESAMWQRIGTTCTRTASSLPLNHTDLTASDR